MSPNRRARGSSRVSPRVRLTLLGESMFPERGRELHTERLVEGTGSGAKAGWWGRGEGFPPLKVQVLSNTRETQIRLDAEHHPFWAVTPARQSHLQRLRQSLCALVGVSRRGQALSLTFQTVTDRRT